MFNLSKRKTTNWDKVAEQYDRLIGDSGDFNHKTYINPIVLSILGSVRNKNILDLACGQGYFSKILNKKGANVVGIDISEKLIEIAREKFGSLGVEFLVRDAAHMEGISGGQFDAVICNMSFHDIKHVSETIDEIARVVRIGGKLVFSIPHPWTHMAKTIKEGDDYYLRLEKYRTELEVPNALYEDEGIVSYHRPLEYYVGKLTEYKFEITDFVEISREHDQGEKITDKAFLNHKKEFPSFLVMGAVKNLTG
jgi:ubiquinone/menaquinone biosynthesis C-methylase UbiE